jgi:hypothetical protein
MTRPRITPCVLRGLRFVAEILEFPDEIDDLDETPIRLSTEMQKDLRHTLRWIRAMEEYVCDT